MRRFVILFASGLLRGGPLWYNLTMLDVKGVSFKQILHGVSFMVKPGELVVITGPNGSGKSTLAKCLMGVNKCTGKIVFKGNDISDKDCTARARMGMAFAFQQPVQFKGVTVRDLLQMAIRGGEAFLDEKQPKVDKYLKAVGLGPDSYLDREVNGSLSGGELKRIEIASVLARNAELCIFDEPEAGIDIWSFDNLIKIFKSMRGAERAIVIISHQERIMRLADRIIVLKDGKIAADGPSKKILAQMENAK